MSIHPVVRKPVVVLASLLGLALAVVVPVLVFASTPTFTEYPITSPKSGSSDIATGPDGNLWITESSTNKIAKANPSNGSMVEYGLPAGPPYTYSQGPSAIVKGPDGNLWFTDGYTEKISKMTPAGVLTEYPLPSSWLLPDSITLGPDGNLWFTAFSSNQIGAMNTSGTVVHQYAVGGNPEGISVGPDGNIWFAEQVAQKIGKITLSTSVVSTYSVPFTPYDTVAGSDGNVWFSGAAGVGKVVPSSGAVTTYVVDPTHSPINIASGPDGNIWFTMRYEGFGVINPATGSIAQYSTPTASGGGPQNLTTGPDKNIWYVDDNYTNVIGRACLGVTGSSCSSGSGSTGSSGSSGSGSSGSGSSGSSGSGSSGSTGSGSSSGSTGSSGSGSSGSGSSGNTCPNATSADHSASGCSATAPGHTKTGATTTTTSPVNAKITLVINNDDGSTQATVAAGINLNTQAYDAPAKQTLFVDGTLGTVTVKSGATIKGNGKVGKLKVETGAYLAPGHSPGCLASNDLSVAGTYQVQIAGTTACSGYDQVKVTGTVNVSGTLTVNIVSGFAPKAGQKFIIIDNDGTDPVSGTFTGFPEGSMLIEQNTPYLISYKGGDGNDVVLTVAQKDKNLLAASNNTPAAAVKTQATLKQKLVTYGIPVIGVLAILVAVAGLFEYHKHRKAKRALPVDPTDPTIQAPPATTPPTPPTSS